jgi:hypothetical protein
VRRTRRHPESPLLLSKCSVLAAPAASRSAGEASVGSGGPVRSGSPERIRANVTVSTPRIPDPAGLIVSLLTPHDHLVSEVADRLTAELGPIDEQIGPLPFPYTTYYDEEMGSGICRWLFAFRDLVDRGELIRIKLLTNRLEQSYTEDGKRRVNLDPGLMTRANLVLATGKENAHRIYLGSGIFGDLTLVFRRKTYRPLEWTYPDYADPALIAVVNRLREGYTCKLSRRVPQRTPCGA